MTATETGITDAEIEMTEDEDETPHLAVATIGTAMTSGSDNVLGGSLLLALRRHKRAAGTRGTVMVVIVLKSEMVRVLVRVWTKTVHHIVVGRHPGIVHG